MSGKRKRAGPYGRGGDREKAAEREQPPPTEKAGGADGKGKPGKGKPNSKPAAVMRKGYHEAVLEADERKRSRQEYEDDMGEGGPRRRRRRDDDGDAEDEEAEGGASGSSAGAAASAPGSGNAAFASAVTKIMSRTVSSDTALLAKRHTAAEKLVAQEKLETKSEKSRMRERKIARKAHMMMPQSANLDFERQLKKVATKGGASFGEHLSKVSLGVCAGICCCAGSRIP